MSTTSIEQIRSEILQYFKVQDISLLRYALMGWLEEEIVELQREILKHDLPDASFIRLINDIVADLYCRRSHSKEYHHPGDCHLELGDESYTFGPRILKLEYPTYASMLEVENELMDIIGCYAYLNLIDQPSVEIQIHGAPDLSAATSRWATRQLSRGRQVPSYITTQMQQISLSDGNVIILRLPELLIEDGLGEI